MNEYNVNGGLPIGIDIAARAQGGGAPDLEEKTVTVTENGTTEITPSAGKDGISKVELTVNVPPTPITQVGSTLYIGTEGTDNA